MTQTSLNDRIYRSYIEPTYSATCYGYLVISVGIQNLCRLSQDQSVAEEQHWQELTTKNLDERRQLWDAERKSLCLSLRCPRSDKKNTSDICQRYSRSFSS